MKRRTILFLLLLAGCRPDKGLTLNGRWKMQRIEIFKNEVLAKVIKEDSQYWYFNRPSQIEIRSDSRPPTILQVKIKEQVITTFDSVGGVKEKFRLRQLNGDRLSLTSQTITDNTRYTIIYNLHKVEDTVVRL